MKQNIILSILCLSPILFFAQSKIAVVNIQEVIINMPEAKQADSSLQAFQLELQTAYSEVLAELQEKDSIFRTDSSKWTPTVRDLKKRDLERLYGQLQEWQQSSEKSVQRRQQELIAPLRDKALAAIEKVAKVKGYTKVIEKSVVYFNASSTSDITEAVKKEVIK